MAIVYSRFTEEELRMVTKQAIHNKKSLDEFIKAALKLGCFPCEVNVIWWINEFSPFIPNHPKKSIEYKIELNKRDYRRLHYHSEQQVVEPYILIRSATMCATRFTNILDMWNYSNERLASESRYS